MASIDKVAKELDRSFNQMQSTLKSFVKSVVADTKDLKDASVRTKQMSHTTRAGFQQDMPINPTDLLNLKESKQVADEEIRMRRKTLHLEQQKYELEKKVYDVKQQNQNLDKKSILTKKEISKLEEIDARLQKIRLSEAATKAGYSQPGLISQGVGGASSLVGGAVSSTLKGLPFVLAGAATQYSKRFLDKFFEGFMTYNEKIREASKELTTFMTSDQMKETGYVAQKTLKEAFDEVKTNVIMKTYGFADEAIQAFGEYASTFRQKFSRLDKLEVEKELEGLAIRSHSAGMSLSSFVQEVSDAKYTFGMSEEMATGFVSRVADLEKMWDLRTGSLMSNVKSAQSTLAEFGFSLNQTTGLVLRYSKAIEENKISLQDVVNYAKGLRDADEGQLAFMIDKFKSMGGNYADLINRIESSATTKLGQITMLKGAAQGSVEVAKELGISPSKLQRLTGRGMEEVAAAMAREQYGPGASRFDILTFLTKFREMLGGEQLAGTIDQKLRITEQGYRGVGLKGLSKKEIEETRYRMGLNVGPIDTYINKVDRMRINASNALVDIFTGESSGADLAGKAVERFGKAGLPAFTPLIKSFGSMTEREQKGVRSELLPAFQNENFLKKLATSMARLEDLDPNMRKDMNPINLLFSGDTIKTVMNTLRQIDQAKSGKEYEDAVTKIKKLTKQQKKIIGWTPGPNLIQKY